MKKLDFQLKSIIKTHDSKYFQFHKSCFEASVTLESCPKSGSWLEKHSLKQMSNWVIKEMSIAID